MARCRHHRTRCVHGDEINARAGARKACIDCGTSLHEPLPMICTTTGAPHPGQIAKEEEEPPMPRFTATVTIVYEVEVEAVDGFAVPSVALSATRLGQPTMTTVRDIQRLPEGEETA